MRALIFLACLCSGLLACGGGTSEPSAQPTTQNVVGTYTLIVFETLPVPARTYSDSLGDQIWTTAGSLTLSSTGYYMTIQSESTYTAATRAGEVDTLRAGGTWSLSGSYITMTDTAQHFVMAATIQNGVISDAFKSQYRRE